MVLWTEIFERNTADGGLWTEYLWTEDCGRSSVVVWTENCGRRSVDGLVWMHYVLRTEHYGRDTADGVHWIRYSSALFPYFLNSLLLLRTHVAELFSAFLLMFSYRKRSDDSCLGRVGH